MMVTLTPELLYFLSLKLFSGIRPSVFRSPCFKQLNLRPQKWLTTFCLFGLCVHQQKQTQTLDSGMKLVLKMGNKSENVVIPLRGLI